MNNEGTILVERAVARFDSKDGSKNKDQTYVVGNDEGNATLKVKLTKMALVNMSRDFYYLRRVSDNGANANAQICGAEHSHGPKTNYVVNTDAAIKSGTAKNIDKSYPFKDFFNFCLGNYEGGNWDIDATARSQWYTSQISKVVKNKGKGYHTWRYVTENTIPGIELQQNGISTGIVFKGQIMATDKASRKLKDAIANAKGNPAKDPILYSYANTLYVTWEEVREKAFLTEENSRFYKAVFGNEKKKKNITIKAMGKQPSIAQTKQARTICGKSGMNRTLATRHSRPISGKPPKGTVHPLPIEHGRLRRSRLLLLLLLLEPAQ